MSRKDPFPVQQSRPDSVWDRRILDQPYASGNAELHRLRAL